MAVTASDGKNVSRTRASFTEREAEFLAENFLGRVATVSRSGQPHVVPVAYRFDGEGVTFGGWNLKDSLKFRNLLTNDRVAFVVDEVVSTRPWMAKGVVIRGRARIEEPDETTRFVRIVPRVVRSWGMGGH